MKVISVQQPWAQLIADRRRHILIKGWTVDPGERFAIHASHVVNEAKCKEFGYDPSAVATNAILAIIEVKGSMARKEAKQSKFDYHNPRVRQGKLYAIVVRTLCKFRKPVPMNPPTIREAIWNCELANDWQAIGERLASKQEVHSSTLQTR